MNSVAPERRLDGSDLVGPPTHTILVVEDDPAIANLLVALLQSEGYGVRTAVDGNSAMQYCGESQPDAVFLDITLPDLSGWDVLAQLRARQSAPPILLLTGDSAAVRRARSSGASGALQKPFDIDELLAATRQMLGA